MSEEADPFRHHPELRDSIVDPMASFFRTFSIAEMARLAAEHDLPSGWWHSDEERERMRLADLAHRREGDLWVFGYGSLMWDPAIRFAEVRRARAIHHERKFMLRDIHGGRGTAEQPGLMAALDIGCGCDGLVFRIPKALVDGETEVLYRRERIGPAYTAEFVPVRLNDGVEIEAITFVADHTADTIAANLTEAEQVRLIATGTGFLGSSLDYLRNIEAKFDRLGIVDPHVRQLRVAAEAYIATQESDRASRSR